MPTCFVIQPFDNGGPYDKRYRDILVPAIKEAGLEPYRVDEDPGTTIVIDDIEKGIQDAEVCLADITTNNPNIWYEVGFAFANGKAVVMVCLDPRPDPFPFDIRHRHIIRYKLHAPSDFETLSRGVLCFRRKFVWFMRSRVGKDNYGLSKILQSNGALFIAFPCISISSAIRPEPRPDFAAGRGCQNADRPVGTNCVLRKLSRIHRNNSW